MSGICGLLLNDKEGQVSTAQILPMLKALNFQGEEEGFTLGLGHVAVGAQKFPGRLAGVTELKSNGKPSALAFHGSLYNLNELFPSREQVLDVPCGLLKLYLKEGIGFLARLRGEFVLAIWDGREESLFIATDRFRVHPLYVYQDAKIFAFASRMKGILACPFPIDRKIYHEAIVDVVGSSIIPTPKTIFKAVKKLPAGHFLKYRNREITLRSYWNVGFLNPSDEGERELARELRAYLAESLSVRLATEAEPEKCGTFLSGGIDSSTITGVLTQLAAHPVKAFSIGFGEEKFNEMSYARLAAKAFESEHYEYFVTPEDTYDMIPGLLEAIDEPFANASAIPVYFCAKLAKEEGVNTLYAGDGGDELFAGNERYATQRLFEYYRWVPEWCRARVLEPMVGLLSNQLGLPVFGKIKRYLHRSNLPYYARITSYDFFRIVPMVQFIDEDLIEHVGRNYDPYGIVRHYYFEAPAQEDLDRHLYIDWKLTLVDNDLIKVTRMTEAAGITVRYPFLDHRLVEFSVKVPAHIKMRGRELRTFFKKAYAGLLPAKTREKRKHGFGLPIPVWLRTDKRFNELMRDLVLSPRSLQRGYFKKKALERLVEDHAADKTSFYGTVLWNLMVLELWHRNNSV